LQTLDLPEDIAAMTALEIVTRGGPVMLVLVGLSVFALAILLTKLWQFWRAGLRRTGFIDPILELVADRRLDIARRQLAANGHPTARVIETAIRVGADSSKRAAAAEAEVARVGTRELRDLESWLRALSSIAHLSPLVGLLGTVIGMILAFMQVERSGSTVDPSLLSGGIWQALLTTAYGLTIAIPAMAVFHLLEGEVDRVRASMRDASTVVLASFDKLTGDDLATPGPREEVSDHAV
jgi:biopolymer transport protein ExbB